MKRILSIFLLIAVLISNISAFSQEIYTYTNENYIAEGILRTNLKTLTTSGWQNINIIKADLGSKYVSGEVLIPEYGIGHLETVLKMAENYDTTVSVNTDFFGSAGEQKGSSVGGIIKDNKLLTSTGNKGEFASMALTFDEEVILSYLDVLITVSAPDGESIVLKSLNKYEDLSLPVIYTSDFYETTPGSYDNILEVVIKNNQILEMREGQEGVLIPENGYVIRVLPEYNAFMKEKFAVGDKIKIDIEYNFDIKKVKDLTGGGTLLLKDGEKTEITHDVKGKNPRTAIGLDDKGYLYIITIDGRQERAAGMTLPELQDFLLSYGLKDAINFDGGGSTTLVAKQDEKQNVINMVSGGNYLRPVSTGFGLYSSAPKTNKLYDFKVHTEDLNVFKGGTRTFYSSDFIDTNKHKMKDQKVEYSIDNAYGYFKNNVLYAKKEGQNILVTAKSGGVTKKLYINILQSPEKIEVTPSHFDIKEINSSDFTAYGTNSKNETALIENDDLVISANKITSQGYKEVSFLDVKTYISFSNQVETFDKMNFTGENLSLDTKYSPTGKGIKLSYDFFGYSEDKKSASLTFNAPLEIKTVNKKLCMWVYSPFPIHQALEAEFKGENDEILTSYFSKDIDFAGYKYLVLNIPKGATKLTKIYVKQNEFKEQTDGFLVFDALCVSDYEGEIKLPSNIFKKDEQNSLNQTGTTFVVAGNIPKFNNLLSNLILINTSLAIKKENADYVFSLAGEDFKDIEESTTNGFKFFTKDNSMFLTVDNSGHYITHTQFGKIKDALSNKKDNLFVFLYEDLSLMKDNEEKEVLENLFKEYGAKNTYVFYPSYASKTDAKDKINYIGVGRANITGLLSFKNEPTEYVYVNVLGDKLSLSFKKVF